jgi:hypothetical protein
MDTGIFKSCLALNSLSIILISAGRVEFLSIVHACARPKAVLQEELFDVSMCVVWVIGSAETVWML